MLAVTPLILKRHRPGREASAVCLQSGGVSTQTQQGRAAAPRCQSLGCGGQWWRQKNAAVWEDFPSAIVRVGKQTRQCLKKFFFFFLNRFAGMNMF